MWKISTVQFKQVEYNDSWLTWKGITAVINGCQKLKKLRLMQLSSWNSSVLEIIRQNQLQLEELDITFSHEEDHHPWNLKEIR